MSGQLFVTGLGIGPEADDAWFASGLGAALVEAVDTVPVAELTGTSLSRIQFDRSSHSIIVDAPADRRWTIAASGEAGEAAIRLPRNSRAASSLYLGLGSMVTIGSEGGCGEWVGTITDIDDSDPHTLMLTAYQPGKILGKRRVSALPLRNVTAGYAATVILQQSLAGADMLSLIDDPFEGGSYGATTFDPTGDAWGGLTELMDASEGEIDITVDGQVRWIDPLACAPHYTPLLIEGGNFQDVSYQSSIQNSVAEVTAGEGPAEYTARNSSAALANWPAQASIDGTAADAQREIEARSLPEIVIAGGVTSPHWSIRERMFVDVVAPRAEFGGQTHTCRVLARSLADGDHLMRLELQVMQPVAPTTISGSTGAGARQRPPQRASSDLSSGSFAQVFGLMLRLLGNDPSRQKRIS